MAMTNNNRINNYNSRNDEMILEQRIVSALSDNAITATKLAELISETERAVEDAVAIASRLEETAVDPIASADPVKAREAAEFAAFAAKRLRNVLPRLEQRHQQIIAQVRCTWRPR